MFARSCVRCSPNLTPNVAQSWPNFRSNVSKEFGPHWPQHVWPKSANVGGVLWQPLSTCPILVETRQGASALACAYTTLRIVRRFPCMIARRPRRTALSPMRAQDKYEIVCVWGSGRRAGCGRSRTRSCPIWPSSARIRTDRARIRADSWPNSAKLFSKSSLGRTPLMFGHRWRNPGKHCPSPTQARSLLRWRDPQWWRRGQHFGRRRWMHDKPD